MILMDPSGLDQAEFFWADPVNEHGRYRAWPFQHSWYRDESAFSADQSGRAVGKSVSVTMRAFAFPFVHSGQSMLLTAPEMNHLQPLISAVEERIKGCRITRELLPKSRSNGVNKTPHWQMTFVNGTKLISRIPHMEGDGVKGQHVLAIELDEAQNYPAKGWAEVAPTLNRGVPGARWAVHGVPQGVRDRFYDITEGSVDDESVQWKVHRIMGFFRPTWTDAERAEMIVYYGSRQNIDYKRNLYGEHGDKSNAVFVLSRLMACFFENTLVSVERHGQIVHIPIQGVDVGDVVINGTNRGTILASNSTQRNDLTRIFIQGEEFVCTPEHRWFTTRGWVEAADLRVNDRVIQAEDLPTLWKAADLDATKVLLEAMLRGSSVGEARFYDDVKPEVLLAQLLFEMGASELQCESGKVSIEVLHALRDEVLNSEISRTGRTAGVAKVESVEILEPGSEEFLKLSGGKDSVTVYDLTVSGHPSFFVGNGQFLVHNCCDMDQGSVYNNEVYKSYKIEEEDLPNTKGLDEEQAKFARWDYLEQLIHIPPSHLTGWTQKVGNKEMGAIKGYTSYWAGMDVGVTNHPSEILIFGQRDGSDQLDLLLRVNMHRIKTGDQRFVIERLFQLYGAKMKAFGIDMSGLGQPVWADLTDTPAIAKRVFGYGFAQNRVCGFEDRELTGNEKQSDLAIMRNVVESTTDWLRNDFVDNKRILLPWDKEILLDFQGQTYTSQSDKSSPYGRRRVFSGGSFHVLDAVKMMVAAKMIPPLEAIMNNKVEQADVFDIFLGEAMGSDERDGGSMIW